MWFWLLTIIAILGVILSLDKDNGWGASASLLIYGAVVVLLSDAQIIDWAKGTSPWVFVEVAAGYLVFGTVWGVVKWVLFTRKLAFECEEHYRVSRKQFLAKKGLSANDQTVIPGNLKAAWQQESNQRLSRYDEEGNEISCVGPDGKINPPEARDHKATILMWMSFWPFSALWTLIDDFVKRAFEHIYRLIARHLQEISNKAFASVVELQNIDMEEGMKPEIKD
jgi:hypothetical protein